MTSKFTCRRCKIILKFNNAFHKHLKICDKNVIVNSIIVYFDSKAFSSISSISIKISNVNVSKNIDTNYDFKKFQYIPTKVSLTKHNNLMSVYADTDAEIILIDIMFFNAKTKNVQIKIMIFSIIFRELSTNQHFTNKYVIVSMFFLKKNANDISIKTRIKRETHLIDNFKTNMLIENDILKSKKFDIFTSNSFAYIDSYKIIISISIKNRFISQFASKYYVKTCMILSHAEISISIHKISLFERNYLFESAKLNFSIYFHIVNISINVIIVRNESDKSIKIF